MHNTEKITIFADDFYLSATTNTERLYMDELIFTLLRRALGTAKGNETLPEAIDWSTALTILRNHALLAVAADAIMSLPEMQRPEPSLQMQIMQYCAQVARMHHRLDGVVRDIARMLHDAGLHPILLKGQGLARLYPMRNTRSCGDIDIYLLPEEFDEGCRMIFRYCDSDCDPSVRPTTCVHLNAEKDGDVRIEIHFRPSHCAIEDINDKYNDWMESEFRRMPPSTDRDWPTMPDVQTNVVYVFQHLLLHLRIEGVGLRQFVDWLLLLHTGKDRIDHERLRHDLQRFHLLDAWQMFGGLLVWQLGLPEEEFPLWDRRKARRSQGRNLRFIIDSGNLGTTLTQHKSYYNMPLSFRREVLALKYLWHQQRFLFHVFPYDAGRKLREHLVKTTKKRLKEILN